MLGMFNSVKPYVVPKPKVDVPRPDNAVFRLHYKLTVAVLLVGTILVSSYGYIDSSGSAIQCMMDKGVGVPGTVINRYCWIMSTFTLPKHFEGEIGEDFIHHGVGPHGDDDERIYHAYYQWVPLMLFFQAICFYAPHWIWKQCDNGKIKNVIVGLNKVIDDEDARADRIKLVAGYMRERMQLRGEHRNWAIKFFLCECLNLINVVGQIILTDNFLGGEFTTYGTQVLHFPYENPENRVDPMSRIFPRMTKCIFHKYGGSGTIQRFDALCVLGMNILNEKIYIVLWFWFVILAVITAVNLVVRAMQLFCPTTRQRFVKLETRGFLGRNVDREDVEKVVSQMSYSDFLIFYYLAQSMDKKNFGDLIRYMSNEDPLFSQRRRGSTQSNSSDEEKGNMNGFSRADTLRSSAMFKMKNLRKSLS